MLEFLRSSEKCLASEEAKGSANFLENELCAFRDGSDKPETSCFQYLVTADPEALVTSCFSWWLSGGTTCPALLPGVPTTTTCADALKAAAEDFGCCYRLFGSDDYVNDLTE